jgi:hypothetical protein
MSKIVEQCTVDGELTPELVRYKQDLDAAMETELAEVEANRTYYWIPKERQYADIKYKYEVAWETALANAGYFLRPTFESAHQDFGDWYDHLTTLNESTYTKPISFQDAQNLIRKYAKKVDFSIADEYAQTFGIRPVEGVSIVEAGFAPRKSVFEPPIPLYDIHFKGWNRYYPRVELSRLFDEPAMMKLLIDGFTRSLQYAKVQETTDILKSIDVFASDKYAIAVVLGSSGRLYELRGNAFGEIKVSINNGAFGPATLLREPFEVIYTRVTKKDDNQSTHRDSSSSTYYSWDSAHEEKLAKYLPTTFGRIEGYMGSYSETLQIEIPDSANYSQADQIDSWAMTKVVEVATD